MAGAVTSDEILLKRAAQVERGAARAAVLGVNDGLVSTLCMVLGVAGAGGDQQAVMLAGFAGLIAGAVSMAAGEWISVKAQVELFEGVLHDLRHMVSKDGALLEQQLAKAYAQSGFKAETATRAAGDVAASDNSLYRSYASQVLGMNPNELGSPWVAAVSSLLLFTVGALVPLAPWFFAGADMAPWLSIIFTAVGGLVTGGYIAVSSGKSVLYGSLRQLLIIILAAGVTYGVGFVFGTTVG